MNTANASPPTSLQRGRVGVRIAGSGIALPKRTMTNQDLEKVMDTSDEWIRQRTGIHTRYIVDRENGESVLHLAAPALKNALADAKLDASRLDLIICATMCAEMACPPSACRVAASVGAGNAGALDLSAACCGFVYALNIAHDLIKGGAYRTIGVIGADTLSKFLQYSTEGRGTAIIFGDAAGAVVLTATDDPSKGILAQAMHSDGNGWKEIYTPNTPFDFPPGVTPDPSMYGHVHMNGATVFKFAVGTFPDLIQETLDKVSLRADEVDMFVCHQSNARILHAARDRFGLPEEKLYINIDRYGNTVAASVPLCLHELRAAGRVKDGQKVMFVAFGGGLTWGSSLWQL